MKQFLELEHSTLAVLHPINGNCTLIQLCQHIPLATGHVDMQQSSHATTCTSDWFNQHISLDLLDPKNKQSESVGEDFSRLEASLYAMTAA